MYQFDHLSKFDVFGINEENCSVFHPPFFFLACQRLSGASLLVFANKQDIQGSLSPDEIAKVSSLRFSLFLVVGKLVKVEQNCINFH